MKSNSVFVCAALALLALANRKSKQNSAAIGATGAGENIVLENKIAKFIAEVGTRAMNEEEEQIYNAFTCEKSKTDMQISDMLGLFHIFRIYSDNRKAGAQHILIDHYGEKTDYITANEILKMCEIIKSTKPHEKNGKRIYEVIKGTVRHRIVIAVRAKTGILITYYTNRK